MTFAPWWGMTRAPSDKQLLHHVTIDVGQPKITALVKIGKTLVVKSQAM